MGKATLYISTDHEQVWLEFKKICKREDESASKKILGMLARYVAVHGPGNPQHLLESWTKPTKLKCWRCRGIFNTLIHVKFISGLKTYICPDCKRYYDQRRLIVKVLH